MRRWPVLIGWILAAAAGLAAAIVLFPRAFAFYPETWTVTRQRAIEIARASFPKLGDAVDDPYVVVELHDNVLLEHEMSRVGDRDALLASAAAKAGDRSWRRSTRFSRDVGRMPPWPARPCAASPSA